MGLLDGHGEDGVVWVGGAGLSCWHGTEMTGVDCVDCAG